MSGFYRCAAVSSGGSRFGGRTTGVDASLSSERSWIIRKVSVEAVEQAAAKARSDTSLMRMPLELQGGLACYAMTFALEAAREGVELRAPRAVVRAEVDQGRALVGVSEQPPVERIDWELAVDSDADDDAIERLAVRSDARCPGVSCIRNPIALETRVVRA